MVFKADAPKIKRWREERHWSQEHLAELAGLGLRTVQRIENGDAGSPESLKALAAAFNIDVSALSVDPEVEAADILNKKNLKLRAATRLGFWIHLASYLMGAVVFIAISIADGSGRFVMLAPLIWWTVGVAGHALLVAIIEIVTRHQDQYGEA